MGKIIIEDVVVERQEIIEKTEGNILKIISKNDNNFLGFGEAYFSLIKYNQIKAWRKHKKMTCNLIVPYGSVRVVICDDRYENKVFQEIEISNRNYVRLTIPPNLWTGFKGLSKDTSIILNIANLVHDKNEQETRKVNNFDYTW